MPMEEIRLKLAIYAAFGLPWPSNHDLRSSHMACHHV